MLSSNTYTPSASVADSTSAADNNLRSAITAANGATGAATYTIQLTSGTYAPTQAVGELEISNANHSLTIEGQGSTGPNATIIDQLALARVFQVDPGVTVTFENLEITGGTAESTTVADAMGGGIFSEGNVTLDNVAVVGNKATAVDGGTAEGGGVYSSEGILTIAGTTPGASLIENNSAIGGAPRLPVRLSVVRPAVQAMAAAFMQAPATR